MEANGTGCEAMDTATAERIAGFLAGQSGVAGATVGGMDGLPIASRGAADPATEAALAAFVCERAAEVVSTADLRGMGKLVSESAFERLTISGPGGESLVISLSGACLLISPRPGALSSAAQSATPVIQRFGPGAQRPQGG